MEMSKKILLVLVFVALATVVFAACAPAPTPAPTAAPPTAAPIPPTPVPPATATTAAVAPTAAPTKAPTAVPTAVPPTVAPTAAPLNLGIVLVGPQNDHGWSEANWIGAQYVKSKMPNANWIVIDKLNSADRPSTTLEQVVSDMASKGVKLIFTTSDDFKTDTITAAQKHPDLTFINVSGDTAWKDGTGYKGLANLGNFMGKVEYMKMVAGCTAALTSQTGKIGFLGPLINDETRRLADSAYLGAKYCWTTYAKKNAADLKFDVTWIGFWFNIPGVTLDPTKVAGDFYNSGHDVVISGIDTTEALVVAGQQQAQGKKVYAVSYDFKDGCAEAPNACLGVPYFNWGPAYLKTVQTFVAGTWKPSWDWNAPDWSNLDNPDTGAVGFTFGKGLSDANKTTVQTFIKGLGDGSINLFKGPITLQDGSVYVKDGATAADKEIWYLPQLLQGMTGSSK
jgi:simple sugar transport system substrate-binding protein